MTTLRINDAGELISHELRWHYVMIHPEFRGLGIAESAIHRMIGIFGTACGLVACKPWPLWFTPAIANNPKALKQLALPGVSEGGSDSEAEILLVTPRLLADPQHRNLCAELIPKGL